MFEYKVVEKNNKKYISLNRDGALLQAEQDALDILSICMEHGTNLVLVPGECLSGEFLRLKTGVAGAILQKFVNYRVKVVVVLEDKAEGKFKDFLVESNRGNDFRAYESFEEAERWLLNHQL